MDIFNGLSRKGVTVILVTHDRAIARYARKIVHLKDGKIESTEEVRGT